MQDVNANVYAIAKIQIDGFQKLDKKFQKYINSVQEHQLILNNALWFNKRFKYSKNLYNSILVNQISELGKQFRENDTLLAFQSQLMKNFKITK